jgi:lipopolysaccharide heptosyltransferase II
VPLNQTGLLKSLDRFVARPLVYLFRKAKEQDRPTEMKRILFIRPGGIGDAVLLLPSIRILKEKFPDSSIDILCEKRNSDIFNLSGDINAIFLYDRGLDVFRVPRKKYDVVIDTEQWHRLSAVVASLTGAPVRIGFDTNERRKLFTHPITYSHDNYEVYSFLHLLQPLTDTIPDFMTEKPFLDISGDAGSSLLSELKATNNLIALFPGASVPERRWGGEKFGMVARALSDLGYRIMILGSASDKADADKIKRYAENSLDFTGKTSLRDVASLLKRSTLLISSDSGLLHLAYAVGTPTISLFGSGMRKKWAPRGKRHAVIDKRLPCSPCTKFGYTPPCERGVECLLSITVEEVLRAMEALLGSGPLDKDQKPVII